MPTNFKLSKGGGKAKPSPSASKKTSTASKNTTSRNTASKNTASKSRKSPVSQVSQINPELVSFIEVSKDQWPSIPIGSLVRYYRIDGKFIPGGYISKIWYNDEEKVYYMTVDHEQVIGSNNAHSISLSRIHKIFKHPSKSKMESAPIAQIPITSSAVAPIPPMTVDDSSKFQQIIDYIRKIEMKVNNIESNLNMITSRVQALEQKTSSIQHNTCRLSDVVGNINSSLCNR